MGRAAIFSESIQRIGAAGLALALVSGVAEGRDDALRALEAARVPATAAALVQYAGIGDAHVVKQLLRAGVAADEPLPGRQLRALHGAVAQGHAAIVDQLVAAGAQVNALDDAGCSPLAAAGWRGHLDIMRTLLKAGASVSAGLPGCPVLHQAIFGNQVAAIRLLRAHGADPAQQDDDRRDAYALARILGREALLPALEKE